MVEFFELGVLDLLDFYFTGDDYRYRFEHGPKLRFIELLRDRFNAGVAYKGRVLEWDTVIEQKTNELGRFLTGKTRSLDFAEPAPNLDRQDDKVLRAKILALAGSHAKQVGIGKSTLHYLRKQANSQRSFKIYTKVGQKIDLLQS